MKHEIIKTENYLLVVGGSEIKEGDFVFNKVSREFYRFGENLVSYEKKIIAHLPLNNPPILEGVDLLPQFEQEDDVEEIAFNSFKNQDEWTWSQYKDIFPLGYNKAKEKYKFTEEDMLRLLYWADSDKRHIQNQRFEDFIQSLSQPKMPIGFECEESVFFATNAFSSDITLTSEGLQDTVLKGIKTTTNSQGQTQWVGKYIYE